MKVRKIIARNMSEGLKAVSAELGPDAMILSNRKVDRGIEIMAAVKPTESEQPMTAPSEQWPDTGAVRVDDPPISEPGPAVTQHTRPVPARSGSARPNRSSSAESMSDSIIRMSDQDSGGLTRESLLSLMQKHKDPLAEKRQKLRRQLEDEQIIDPTQADSSHAESRRMVGSTEPHQAAADARRPVASRESSASVSPGSHVEPAGSELDAMRSELAALRAWLEERQSAGTVGKTHPLQNQLERLGFEPRCVQPLVDRFGQGDATESWRRSSLQVASLLERNAHCLIRKGGVAAFVGPTGAGKTTTLSKIATRFAMQHGASDLGIISLDQYRIGAHEPLRILGRILGCDVRLAETGDALEDLLHQFRDKSLILLDTNGSERGLEGFRQQIGGSVIEQQIRQMLVLPANLSAHALAHAWESFGAVRPSGLILTKTDESPQVGGVLSLSLRKKLPLCYWSDGTQVPQDLHFGEVRELLQRSDRSLGEGNETREKRVSIG